MSNLYARKSSIPSAFSLQSYSLLKWFDCDATSLENAISRFPSCYSRVDYHGNLMHMFAYSVMITED